MKPSRSVPSPVWVLLLAMAGFLLIDQTPQISVHDATGETETIKRFIPPVSPASNQGRLAMKTFRIPKGFEVSLVAAEPDVVNPVVLDVDNRGRILVVEAFRRAHGGIVDNRHHGYWIDDDLMSETVEDRRRLLLKHHPEYAHEWPGISDRVRLLIDDDGDGAVDRSLVYADGFDDLTAGTAAGALRVGKDVYFACIPDIWKLTDSDADGVADQQTKIHTGFGVRVAFRGHDMHGLIMGPDGRIYWSIGDRGFNVVDKVGKRHKMSNAGAVFRMEPDGSGFEVFARGLRNPQELAFDDLGNLFTGDNNSDGGDAARIVYVVEGGDTGWRMNYQYIDDRGPWVTEGWYKPSFPHQAAFLVPPIANHGNGPSGFTFDPGVGLPPEWAGRFFLSDFKGSKNRSGVRSFRLSPDGAGFSFHDANWFMQGVLTTDVTFGPDGGIYVTDWVQGWVGPGKGRIYRIGHQGSRDAAADRADAMKLLASSLSDEAVGTLLGLLSHDDRRIRQKAHLELARRGTASLPHLARHALNHDELLGRIHAIWAASIISRRTGAELAAFRPLLWVQDPEVRAQAVKALGESADQESLPRIVELLNDTEQRIAYFAAMALPSFQDRSTITDLVDLLRRNQNADVFIRHACIHALSQLDSGDAMAAAIAHENQAVRLSAVCVLRRQGDERVKLFLFDPDPDVSTEAARAIYDQPIETAFQDLANCLDDQRPDTVPTARRALGAWYLIGGQQAVSSITACAADETRPVDIRLEALSYLKTWSAPPLRDPILNMPVSTPNRSKQHLRHAVAPALQSLLKDKNASIRAAVAEIAGATGLTSIAPSLMDLIAKKSEKDAVKVASLNALSLINADDRGDIARKALKSRNSRVRAAALNLIVALGGPDAAKLTATALETGGLLERQLALGALGRMSTPETDALLVSHMQMAIDGAPTKGCLLELLKSARMRAENDKGGALARQLMRYESTKPEGDSLFQFRAALAGGSISRGRKLFTQSTKAQCNRCHNLTEKKTEQPGPDLTDVGNRLTPREILQSIAQPNASIAEGFENVLVETKSGRTHAGRLVSETDDILCLEVIESGTPETVQIKKSSIVERVRTQSSMPGDLIEQLSLHELRDLVSFLSQLVR